MITIIDYGMGNVGSVQNMLRRIGAESELCSDPDRVLNARKLILPGVGAFDQGMTALGERGLIEPLNEAVSRRGVPVLGICLGMQLLTEESEEGTLPGLGLHKSRTVRIAPAVTGDRSLRVPHMGWNVVRPERGHPLIDDLPAESRFYFVHSYHVVCDVPNDALLSVEYGSRLTASFANGPVLGVQFHPEKSHKFGMALMRNYAERDVC